MSNKRQFELKFDGRFADGQVLPVATLTTVLAAMQRAVHLLAMQQENVSVRQKERINKTIENKYPLLCTIPKQGSYIMPVEIGDPTAGLFVLEDIESVSSLFTDCCNLLASGNKPGLAGKIPDQSRRDLFIKAARNMAPSLGSGIKVGLAHIDSSFNISLNTLHERGKACLSTAPETELQQIRTVTGRLSEIQFDERKITLVYPVTQKELVCIYSESVEDMLLDRPRELIQVTGDIILDDNEQPKKIVNVESIVEVDLSPFYLQTIEHSGRSFAFIKPLELTPDLDETQQLFCLDCADLGIDVYAYTRDQLDLELREQIAFLWDSYALADDGELTEPALQLKKNLLDALKEVTGAA
jgi:hypothetical protein